MTTRRHLWDAVGPTRWREGRQVGLITYVCRNCRRRRVFRYDLRTHKCDMGAPSHVVGGPCVSLPKGLGD